MPHKSPAKLEVRVARPADVDGILALISRAYPGIENYSAGQVRGPQARADEGGAGEVGYLPIESDEPAPEGVGSFEWAAAGGAFARELDEALFTGVPLSVG